MRNLSQEAAYLFLCPHNPNTISCVCVYAYACVQMEDVFTRAVKGGSGGIKAVGNYAGSLLPQVFHFVLKGSR